MGTRKKWTSATRSAKRFTSRTGEETMISDLTYDLRSGEPDAIDQIVAITFANVAVDLIREGITAV